MLHRLMQKRASVLEARNALALTEAGARPAVSARGQASAVRMSETGQLPIGAIPGYSAEQMLYSAGFDASWEIDLFGRQSLREDASLAQISLREESVRDAQISLTAELVRAWVELQSVRAERALLHANLDRQREIVEMVAQRREHGEASDIEVEQAELRRLQTAASEPSLNMRERLARNQIAILTGQTPYDLTLDSLSEAPLPEGPQAALSSMPSDVLAQRADVRSAERQYALAARQLDLTRLDIYPSFSLIGSIGPETTDISEFLSPESLAANLAAMASWSLWDGGRQEASEAVGEARLQQAELAYAEVVLTAVNDVESAAVRYGETLQLVSNLEAVLASAERLNGYALGRYEGGTGTVLQVTETERDQIDVERQLTEARRDALFAYIALMKALGGAS